MEHADQSGHSSDDDLPDIPLAEFLAKREALGNLVMNGVPNEIFHRIFMYWDAEPVAYEGLASFEPVWHFGRQVCRRWRDMIDAYMVSSKTMVIKKARSMTVNSPDLMNFPLRRQLCVLRHVKKIKCVVVKSNRQLRVVLRKSRKLPPIHTLIFEDTEDYEVLLPLPLIRSRDMFQTVQVPKLGQSEAQLLKIMHYQTVKVGGIVRSEEQLQNILSQYSA